MTKKFTLTPNVKNEANGSKGNPFKAIAGLLTPDVRHKDSIRRRQSEQAMRIASYFKNVKSGPTVRASVRHFGASKLCEQDKIEEVPDLESEPQVDSSQGDTQMKDSVSNFSGLQKNKSIASTHKTARNRRKSNRQSSR